MDLSSICVCLELRNIHNFNLFLAILTVMIYVYIDMNELPWLNFVSVRSSWQLCCFYTPYISDCYWAYILDKLQNKSGTSLFIETLQVRLLFQLNLRLINIFFSWSLTRITTVAILKLGTKQSYQGPVYGKVAGPKLNLCMGKTLNQLENCRILSTPHRSLIKGCSLIWPQLCWVGFIGMVLSVCVSVF